MHVLSRPSFTTERKAMYGRIVLLVYVLVWVYLALYGFQAIYLFLFPYG
jgi:hypothetical protein